MGACGLADFVIVTSLYIDNILRTGNDAGFFFDGWFSDEEKEKITDLLEKMPEYKINEELKIIEHINKINKSLNKTSPANEKIFNMNVWKYVKENIVSFIYTINQPRKTAGAQSPFTNISLYDKYFLKEMASSYILFDHNVNIDTVNKLQLLYVDIMNDELKRTPITFPVTTGCFVVDDNNEIQDKIFLHELAKRNLKKGFINFYCGKSSTLSSCCFRGDEIIDIYDKESQENRKITIKEFVESYSEKYINKRIEKNYKINSYNINSDDIKKEECYITGVLKKENKSKKLIKIQIGDKFIHVTPDHEFKCIDTDLKRIIKIDAMELYNHWEKYLIPIED